MKTKLAQKIVTGWIVGLQGMVEKNEFKLICNRKSVHLTKKRTKMIKTEKSKSYCSLMFDVVRNSGSLFSQSAKCRHFCLVVGSTVYDLTRCPQGETELI